MFMSMKNKILKTGFVFTILVVLTLLGCSKNSEVSGCTNSIALNYNSLATVDDGSCIVTPFQGPRNGNFENISDWMIQQGNGTSYFSYETGVGFMPTQGIQFAQLHCESTNNFYSTSLTVYQDNVDFTYSDSLIFDYSYNTQTSVGTGGNVYVNIFFTSNGTDTIWSKSYTNVPSFEEEMRDFSVALPINSKRLGRFTMSVEVEASGVYFLIDNIRTI